MRRYFNTEGRCRPDLHYMVRIDDRLDKIKRQYIDRGKYFIINRGRQYGKTTTLMALAEYLKDDYTVLSMDFQLLDAEEFKDSAVFSKAFARMFIKAWKNSGVKDESDLLETVEQTANCEEQTSMTKLFGQLSDLCAKVCKPLVMMIDEVDSASNNQVFLDLLSKLRYYYLNRENSPTFQSVILAGVYDIENLRLKLRPERERRYNSPWNIAEKFTLDMNFSVMQISDMLQEYEEENHTGMDIQGVSACIYEYTSGYPYLVSAICKMLDRKIWEGEKSLDVWTTAGVAWSAKSILLDPSVTLIRSMMKQVAEYPDMKKMLHAILFQGKRITYNPDHPVIGLAEMFGYVVNRENCVQVANRIFEMRLYNFFLSEEEMTNAIYNRAQENFGQFIRNGRLDMRLVLEKFVMAFTEIYGGNEEKFMEEYGRKFFLLYLKPIINGVGNYYVEAQTRDAKRTDVIVDYLGEQFIVEMKIWRGNEYNERGERQLAEYLDYFRLEKGYMLSFNFNQKKEVGVKTIELGDKTIVEAVV